LDLCPSFIDIRTRLGNVLRDMGDADAALAEYQQARSLKPDYVPARLALGVTLYSLGRRDEAIAEWESILGIGPNDRRARAYLRMVRDQQHPPAPGSALSPHDGPFTPRED